MVDGWLCCMVLLSTTLMYLSLPSMMPMFSPYLLRRKISHYAMHAKDE